MNLFEVDGQFKKGRAFLFWLVISILAFHASDWNANSADGWWGIVVLPFALILASICMLIHRAFISRKITLPLIVGFLVVAVIALNIRDINKRQSGAQLTEAEVSPIVSLLQEQHLQAMVIYQLYYNYGAVWLVKDNGERHLIYIVDLGTFSTIGIQEASYGLDVDALDANWERYKHLLSRDKTTIMRSPLYDPNFSYPKEYFTYDISKFITGHTRNPILDTKSRFEDTPQISFNGKYQVRGYMTDQLSRHDYDIVSTGNGGTSYKTNYDYKLWIDNISDPSDDATASSTSDGRYVYMPASFSSPDSLSDAGFLWTEDSQHMFLENYRKLGEDKAVLYAFDLKGDPQKVCSAYPTYNLVVGHDPAYEYQFKILAAISPELTLAAGGSGSNKYGEGTFLVECSPADPSNPKVTQILPKEIKFIGFIP